METRFIKVKPSTRSFGCVVLLSLLMGMLYNQGAKDAIDAINDDMHKEKKDGN